jgi:hypothetical protein
MQPNLLHTRFFNIYLSIHALNHPALATQLCGPPDATVQEICIAHLLTNQSTARE